MDNFSFLRGYLPIVLILAAGGYVRLYSRWKANHLISKWLAGNPQYILKEEAIKFPLFKRYKYVYVDATDPSGAQVRIVLRLGRKWISGFLDSAVCESIEASAVKGVGP